jgi:hypothetical protein
LLLILFQQLQERKQHHGSQLVRQSKLRNPPLKPRGFCLSLT